MKMIVDDGVKKVMSGKEEQKEEKKDKKEKTGDLEKEEAKTAKGGAKVHDKDMADALKVAQEAERLEEEEFMRKAIAES